MVARRELEDTHRDPSPRPAGAAIETHETADVLYEIVESILLGTEERNLLEYKDNLLYWHQLYEALPIVLSRVEVGMLLTGEEKRLFKVNPDDKQAQQAAKKVDFEMGRERFDNLKSFLNALQTALDQFDAQNQPLKLAINNRLKRIWGAILILETSLERRNQELHN